MSLTLTAAVRTNKPKRNVNIISAANGFSLAIQKNGRAFGWGTNSNGQVGDNSSISRFTPVNVLGVTKTFCLVIGGLTSSYALDKNGKAWAWGSNANGRLGDGTLDNRLTPVSIYGNKTFCKISGVAHALAIDKNGIAWGWGINGSGRIGDNSITQRLTPVSIVGAVKTFCKISAGGQHSHAIDKNGRLWGWGDNQRGQVGNNSIASQLTPVSVAGAIKTFCEISTTLGDFSVAIDKNGRAWGWGFNNVGQLGINSTSSARTPTSILGAIKTFCKISAGGQHCLAIDKNGRAWGWGGNGGAQLGDNSLSSRLTPVSVLGAVKTFCQINAGSDHSLAIDKNGRAWAWGANSNGVLGININANRCTPISLIGAAKTFCEIFSDSNVATIDKNGRAWCWGLNNLGQVGDGTATPIKRTPVSIAGAVKTFCKITTGIASAHTLAIDKNGRAWGWGWNGYRQLGDNTNTNRCTPVSVAGAVKTFCEIASGWGHGLAIDKNGRVWAWGLNNTYQAGDGTPNTVVTPKAIVGVVKTFCKISAGFQYSLAIDKNGQVWAWGRNANGQTGVPGAGVNVTTPSAIGGTLKTFCKIDAGQTHSMVIDKNGRAWGWGDNGSGKVGNGTAAGGFATPVSVAGAIKTFCHISAGNTHTVAIDKNGRAWGWGDNAQGQIGDGSVTSRLTPVSVAGAIKTFCKINAGASSTIALDKNGRVWAWGFNFHGQLGNGLSIAIETPIQICNI